MQDVTTSLFSLTEEKFKLVFKLLKNAGLSFWRTIELLFYFLAKPQLIEAIFALMPASEHLTIVKEKKEDDGLTVLHYTVYHYPNLFKTILNLLPINERLTAIKEKSRGETVLERAARHPELLKTIFDLYPENERLIAVKEKDESNRAILDRMASSNLDSCRILLENLPHRERIDDEIFSFIKKHFLFYSKKIWINQFYQDCFLACFNNPNAAIELGLFANYEKMKKESITALVRLLTDPSSEPLTKQDQEILSKDPLLCKAIKAYQAISGRQFFESQPAVLSL